MTPNHRLELAQELERRALLYADKIIPSGWEMSLSLEPLWANGGPENACTAAHLFIVAEALRRAA